MLTWVILFVLFCFWFMCLLCLFGWFVVCFWWFDFGWFWWVWFAVVLGGLHCLLLCALNVLGLTWIDFWVCYLLVSCFVFVFDLIYCGCLLTWFDSDLIWVTYFWYFVGGLFIKLPLLGLIWPLHLCCLWFWLLCFVCFGMVGVLVYLFALVWFNVMRFVALWICSWLCGVWVIMFRCFVFWLDVVLAFCVCGVVY